MGTTGVNQGDRLAEKLRSEYRYRGARANRSSETARVHTARAESKQTDRRARYSTKDRADGRETVAEEIRVERKRIPAGFLFVLAFCTVMIMLIIMSVAQIYQSTRELSALERDVAALKETIGDLELALDEKNDIRLIEQMATASLGMVKEDSLQRKYISLSEGECIDLIEDPDAADAVGENGGTMLSSIFAALGDFFGFSE